MDDEDGFWAKIEIAPGCWLWTGPVGSHGYGMAQWGRGRRRTTAHRIAYALSRGVPLPTWTAQVLHSCDTKLCCRPSHLSLGSPRQNTLEAFARGLRGRQKRGTR